MNHCNIQVIDEETGFVVQDAPDNYNEDKKFQQVLSLATLQLN